MDVEQKWIEKKPLKSCSGSLKMKPRGGEQLTCHMLGRTVELLIALNFHI